MRIWISLFLLCAATTLNAQNVKLSPVNTTIVNHVSEKSELIKSVNQQIWNFAEVGLLETRSSELLQSH